MTIAVAEKYQPGSDAEERIRVKAEAWLRKRHPEARIVHELVMRQGGSRIDVAAVCPDRLIGCEIKSERDTLDRLSGQLDAAFQVCDLVLVCIAATHRDALCRAAQKDIGLLWRAKVYLESTDSFAAHPDFLGQRDAHICSAKDRLDMLWAAELQSITRACGTTNKTSRGKCIELATEYLTGRQVRQACCAALRGRAFPRADPPVRP